MGEIDRLTEDITWPISEEDVIRWPYFREVISILTQEIGSATNATVNILLDQAGNTLIYYFGVPNDAGIYPVGTWRIRTTASITDGIWTIEQYDGSVWVEKSKLTTGKLFTTGGVGFESVTVTANYTIPDNVYSVTCNATSSINVTLPSLTGNRSIRVHNKGSLVNNIIGTINDEINLNIYPGETWDLVDSLTTWTV